MKKVISFLIPIILIPLGLEAQGDTIKSTYVFNLTGVVNSVNGSNKTIITSNASNTIRWKNFESGTNTDYQLISDNGKNAVNDFTIRIQPRIVQPKSSIFSFAQLSSLESKKITHRFEGGVGGGKTLFKTKYLESTVSYGVLYFDNAYQDLTMRKGFRHSPRFQIFGKADQYKVAYSYEIYYQPSTRDLSDYILRSKASIGFDLNKKVTINMSYVTWYETYFITGSMNDIKTFSFGTSYKID